MVAIFNSPDGLEAYLGRRMSNSVTGSYHPATNRFVVYDYGQNRSFKEGRDKATEKIKTIPATLEGKRAIDRFSRQVREIRDDANIGTIMHEVAHQMSFNTGLLNRQGDVAAWLAEGLACYCEGSNGGAWLGIGSSNPRRAAVLARQKRGEDPYLPLKALVTDDDWLRRGDQDTVQLGYAQSWVLFRLLMDERPDQLRKYLRTIDARRTPDRRFADFVECIGDFEKLEARYKAYLKEIAQSVKRPGK